ncbi:MAG: hypothetical protein KIT80_04795 [Chitinophagaceae bacterium]|nr:hypothetical protein [Chitinophagaceae bacterium]MCW5926210.1 hypothetical protein [Chitinophagaceae bacterium]
MLLLVFVFAATPKRFLHHQLVKHSAATEQNQDVAWPTWQKYVPECPCEGSVTLPAFTGEVEFRCIAPVDYFKATVHARYVSPFPGNIPLSTSLRGPPAGPFPGA